MRLALTKDSVKEIFEIWGTPVYEEGDKPVGFYVEVFEPCTKIGIERGLSEIDTIGEYEIDGTAESLEKAQKSFDKVLEQLLVKGYARLEDFGEGFELY